MDFSEAMAALGERAQKLKGNLNTEEATKTTLVLPFINEWIRISPPPPKQNRKQGSA